MSLVNVGVNGYTTEDVIANELPQLAPIAPRVVTLAIGANDIVHGSTTSAYQGHLRQILAAVVAAGVETIVSIPQPDWAWSPAAADFGSPAALHASILAFNAVLATETRAVGGTYIDLFPIMEEQAKMHLLAADGLHPSATAYNAWAASLATQIAPPCAK